MAKYDFLREDGAWVEKIYPIGQCPREITDTDGVRAKRAWRRESLTDFSWKEGQETETARAEKNARRTQDNINAGKRGREEWLSKMPRLITE